jgi:hypothetical protein
VATLEASNADETLVVPMVRFGGVSVGGSLESGGRICFGAFGRNLPSDTVKMCSHLILR